MHKIIFPASICIFIILIALLSLAYLRFSPQNQLQPSFNLGTDKNTVADNQQQANQPGVNPDKNIINDENSYDQNYPVIIDNCGIPGSEQDKKDINAVYQKYLLAGLNCDTNLAYSIITEQSKSIVSFTCENLASETECYRDREVEVRALESTGIVFRTPFDHKVENPFLFTKENNQWKLDFGRMSTSIAMSGYTCDSGWGWITEEAKNDFCCHFIGQEECPDK